MNKKNERMTIWGLTPTNDQSTGTSSTTVNEVRCTLPIKNQKIITRKLRIYEIQNKINNQNSINKVF